MSSSTSCPPETLSAETAVFASADVTSRRSRSHCLVALASTQRGGNTGDEGADQQGERRVERSHGRGLACSIRGSSCLDLGRFDLSHRLIDAFLSVFLRYSAVRGNHLREIRAV